MIFAELHTRGQPRSMMFEKVMIQLGVHFNRKVGGGGHERGTRDAEDAEKNQLGKQRMRNAKAKSRKVAKAKQRGTVNAEDAK